VLFDANISAAIRCSSCGKPVIRDISLFDLSKNYIHEESCECGNTILKIKSSDYKTFRVYIDCIACGKEHLFVLNSRQLLSEKVKILSCPASSLDIAFVGNKILVREMALKVERDLQELIKVLEV